MNIAKQTQIFNNPEAGAFSGFERNLAFISGINNYQNGISPLRTAVNDAKKLVEVLRSKHKYQVWVCLEEYQALVRENPTYEQVICHVMLRMVAIGGGELARRRVTLSELEYPPEKNSLVQQIIERFSVIIWVKVL